MALAISLVNALHFVVFIIRVSVTGLIKPGTLLIHVLVQAIVLLFKIHLSVHVLLCFLLAILLHFLILFLAIDSQTLVSQMWVFHRLCLAFLLQVL